MVEEAILPYLLALYLALIRPAVWVGRCEAAFQLLIGAVLAGTKGVRLAVQLLQNAPFALLSCLGNCKETKMIASHLKRIIWHRLLLRSADLVLYSAGPR